MVRELVVVDAGPPDCYGAAGMIVERWQRPDVRRPRSPSPFDAFRALVPPIYSRQQKIVTLESINLGSNGPKIIL